MHSAFVVPHFVRCARHDDSSLFKERESVADFKRGLDVLFHQENGEPVLDEFADVMKNFENQPGCKAN